MANYNYYFLYVAAYPVEIWVLIIMAFTRLVLCLVCQTCLSDSIVNLPIWLPDGFILARQRANLINKRNKETKITK